jgi:hypothetical protein
LAKIDHMQAHMAMRDARTKKTLDNFTRYCETVKFDDDVARANIDRICHTWKNMFCYAPADTDTSDDEGNWIESPRSLTPLPKPVHDKDVEWEMIQKTVRFSTEPVSIQEDINQSEFLPSTIHTQDQYEIRRRSRNNPTVSDSTTKLEHQEKLFSSDVPRGSRMGIEKKQKEEFWTTKRIRLKKSTPSKKRIMFERRKDDVLEMIDTVKTIGFKRGLVIEHITGDITLYKGHILMASPANVDIRAGLERKIIGSFGPSEVYFRKRIFQRNKTEEGVMAFGTRFTEEDRIILVYVDRRKWGDIPSREILRDTLEEVRHVMDCLEIEEIAMCRADWTEDHVSLEETVRMLQNTFRNSNAIIKIYQKEQVDCSPRILNKDEECPSFST